MDNRDQQSGSRPAAPENKNPSRERPSGPCSRAEVKRFLHQRWPQLVAHSMTEIQTLLESSLGAAVPLS